MGDKPGKALERLVAALEQALGHDSGRIVEYDKRIQHLVTGKKRQFDVVVTQGEGHHVVITAIECKDHKRPVDVEKVEAFISKIQGCNVHRGILVSSKGFSEDALKLSAAHKITTITLEEVEIFDWLSPDFTFAEHIRHVDRLEVWMGLSTLLPDLDTILASGACVTDANGVKLDNDFWSRLTFRSIPWQEIAPGGARDFVLDGPDPQLWIEMADGERLQIHRIGIKGQARVEAKHVPMALHTYATPGRGIPVASADIQVGDGTMKLMMVREADDTTRVIIVPSAKP